MLPSAGFRRVAWVAVLVEEDQSKTVDTFRLLLEKHISDIDIDGDGIVTPQATHLRAVCIFWLRRLTESPAFCVL